MLNKLLEKSAQGLIDDTDFSTLTSEYQAKQSEVILKIAAQNADRAKLRDMNKGVGKLREALREYHDIKVLTPFILAKLIDRIIVGHKQTIDGEQEIVIIWRFVGEL